LALVLVAGGGIGGALYYLQSRMDVGQVDDLLGTNRPKVPTSTVAPSDPKDPYSGRALNILVMGTDSREGANTGISADDDEVLMRSDTTFIAHVSADRTRVELVSIPRDTLIYIPDCQDAEGYVVYGAGWYQKFNAAFAFGADAGDISTGAACTIRAVEEMSGVYIDAYVVIDFAGFVKVVDAIGGLDVTMRCDLYSEKAGGLDLPEGVAHLDGYTAVQLARARTGDGVGDGSDLNRIKRQQALVKALFAKIVAMDYVSDFPKLYGLASAVLGSLSTNLADGNLLKMVGFGLSMKNFNPDTIYSITIPVGSAPDGGSVLLLDWLADPIWDALRNDTPLPRDDDDDDADVGDDSWYGDQNGGGTVAGASTNLPDAGPPPPPYIQSESDCWW
jgi:LCP family protein required for cell wall assembly